MNFRKLLTSTALTLGLVLVLAGCASTKDVAYFQNSSDVDFSKSAGLYDARIMPKDQLSITVTTTDPEAAVPFNMTVPTAITVSQRTNSTSQPMLQTYLVDNDGYIDFPQVGKVHLGGLTKSEAEQTILLRCHKVVEITKFLNFSVYFHNPIP